MSNNLLKTLNCLLIALLSTAIYRPLTARDSAETHTPIDDQFFAQVADYFAYDPGLPLHAKVLDTQIYGPDLPYAVDKVHFRSAHNEVVPGLFAYPRDGAAPCAAVILLHGNNGAQGIDHTWVRSWLDILSRAGYCALAIDAYGYGERLLPEQNKDADMGLYEWRERTIQQAIDTRRALDYLGTRAQVDTNRIAVMGESMGGIIGLRAAGLDPRLKALVIIVTAAGEFPPSGPFGRFANTLNFAPRISTPVLMVNATADEYTTKEAVEALYAVLPQPKALKWHESGHLIPVPDQRRIILPWLENHIKPNTSP